MKKHAARKRKISRSLLAGSLLTLVSLGLLLGLLGSYTYRRGMMKHYEAHLESLLRLTRSQIDADDLAACIASGEKSEQYEKEQAYLDSMKMTCDVKYVYVVKPLNTEETDNMMNVIAGVSDLEREQYADMLVQLGQLTGTEYSPEVAGIYLERMDRSDSISYFRNTTQFGHMYTGLTPLHDRNGDPVAILAIDVEMDQIRRALTLYNLVTGACILVLSLHSFFYTVLWLRRRIIRPIERMRLASSNFVESTRSTQDPDELRFEDPEIRTRDEMEDLSETLLTMSEYVKRFMKDLVTDAAEKERMTAEFNVAKQIQTNMLPKASPPFPEHGEFDLAGALISSNAICGDFYDYFLIDEDHLGLVLGDVTDKDVAAALFMVIVKTMIRNLALQGFGPAEVLQNVSEQLLEGDEAGLFCTVWFAVLELSTGKGVAVNAGQQHPALRRAGGRFELQKYSHFPPLGVVEGVRYREHGFQLYPDDTLFLYSDGVLEAANDAGEIFTADRVLEALNREPDASPTILQMTVQSAVDRFSGGALQDDEMTMLCLKYYGSKGSPD